MNSLAFKNEGSVRELYTAYRYVVACHVQISIDSDMSHVHDQLIVIMQIENRSMVIIRIRHQSIVILGGGYQSIVIF